MDEETLVQGSIRPKAPQPITINGNTYVFDPVSRNFTARLADFTAKETERIRRLARQVRSPSFRARRESTPRSGWASDWAAAFNEMTNNKSEDWYIPGRKE